MVRVNGALVGLCAWAPSRPHGGWGIVQPKFSLGRERMRAVESLPHPWEKCDVKTVCVFIRVTGFCMCQLMLFGNMSGLELALQWVL